jgi:hypothetical protein
MQRDKIFRWLLCALLIFTGWFVSGCAGAIEEAPYRIVEIPVRCDTARPEKPAKEQDALISLINALAYAEQLELALDACLK